MNKFLVFCVLMAAVALCASAPTGEVEDQEGAEHRFGYYGYGARYPGFYGGYPGGYGAYGYPGYGRFPGYYGYGYGAPGFGFSIWG